MCEISIITPAYNTQDYISQAIESTLKQTFKDFEFIIVDDGSTDLTPEIIKKYTLNKDGSKIKYIRKANEGQGIARNYALTLAKGKYILYLDSDDWFCSDNSLQKLYDKMEQENCDILLFNFISNYQEDGRIQKVKFVEPYYSTFKGKSFKPIDAKDILFETNGLPFKMYRKKFLLDKEILYSKLKYLEDSEFYIKALLCADKIALLNDYIVNYRVHKASTSFRANENIQTMKKVFYICEKVFKENRLDNSKEHTNAFVWNCIRKAISHYNRIDNEYKNEYYKVLKSILKYIDKNYNYTEFKKRLVKIRYNKILRYNNFFYRFSNRFDKTKVLLGLYF